MGSTGPEEPKAPLLKSTAPPGPASPLMPKGPARGDASALMSVVSIVKNIVGAGVLSLPAGLAAAGTVRAGVLAAVLLGLLAGYMFAVIGRVCGAVHAGSFGAVAARTNSKGFATVCEVVCIFKTAAGCLAYSILIRDSAGALLAGYLDVPQTPALGRTLLMGLTAAVLLPLCLLRSLASLQYTSILGLLGMIYTTLFMAYRLYDGSYAADGHYHAYMQEHLQPHFPPEPEERPMLALVLVSLLSTAYMAHYNVPRFYWSLKDTSPGRFQGVVACAFVMTIALFVAFMVIGFLTFGENCQGFVLNNYSTQDPLAAAARLVIGLSIICTYPLVFMGLKEGFTDFAGLSGDTKTNFQVTCALLLVIMGLAFVIENVALVNSFVGAILGSFIIYIVPVLMFRGCAHLLPSGWTTTELALHKIIFAMGVVFGLGGCIIGILEETHPELFE